MSDKHTETDYDKRPIAPDMDDPYTMRGKSPELIYRDAKHFSKRFAQEVTENRELKRELGEAKAWKDSAMIILNELDLQSIGKQINASLGQSIAPAVLPWIIESKKELTQLRVVAWRLASRLQITHGKSEEESIGNDEALAAYEAMKGGSEWERSGHGRRQTASPCGEEKWLCNECQTEFTEDRAATEEIGTSGELVYACPVCHANCLDSAEALTSPAERREKEQKGGSETASPCGGGEEENGAGRP